MVRISLAVACCLLAGSMSSCSQGPATAAREAGVLRGDAKGAAADNQQCKLFSTAEAGRYIGASVKSMQNATMGLGCQWLVGNGHGDMIVSVLPARYYTPPTAADGYKSLPNIGVRGFVSPQMGGWLAGSIVGEQGILVSLAGKDASESTAVDLLKETMKRYSALPSK